MTARAWVVVVKWKDGREGCYGPFVNREIATMLQWSGFSQSVLDSTKVYELEQP